jgi:meiosis induction protein kinase IME2/SME1
MTVMYEVPHRQWPTTSATSLCLEDKFEVLKEIGDGSFGSVALARVRSAGAQVARRGTLVCTPDCVCDVPTFNND